MALSAAVLAEADCDLLVDVNNIYVNSINHRYDALQFLQAYRRFGISPTLLERDFNLPPSPQLLMEVERIRAIQQQSLAAASTGKVYRERAVVQQQ